MKAKVVVLVLALAACSSPDPIYYQLQTEAGSPETCPPITVEVRRPGLAGYLDRSDVVLKSAGYKLDVDSQIRWAEPLGDMIGRVLTQDLGQRLPAASVFSEAGAISADPAVRVEVNVQTFDTDSSGTAVLTATTAIERGATHRPITTRTSVLRAKPENGKPSALAATLSELLGQLADHIAADIHEAASHTS